MNITRRFWNFFKNSAPLRSYWAVGLFAGLAQGLPLLLVRFPPVTDLPQHLAQTHDLFRVLEGAPQLLVSPIAPQGFVYWLLAAFSLIAPPLVVGRLVLWLLLAATVAMITLWARREKRTPVVSMLASLAVGGTALRWGLLPFLAGFSVFLGFWLLYTSRSRRHWGWLIFLGFLLYSAHLLWLAFACLAVLLRLARGKGGSIRQQIPSALTLLPAGLLTLFYTASSQGFWGEGASNIWVHYARWWWRFDLRINSKYLGLGAFSLLGLLLTSALGIYLFAGLWRCWKERNQTENQGSELAIPTLLALACYCLLPEQFSYIIQFASRWHAPFVVLAVLALPEPRQRIWSSFYPILFTLCIGQRSVGWINFEEQEMSGLEKSLDLIPKDALVLGLDLVQRSSLGERPFLQTFAYSESLSDASTNFSFTRHSSSYVQQRKKIASPFTPGLEWRAHRVTPSDVAQSEYVLVNALPKMHSKFQSKFNVENVTRTGRWQLYRAGVTIKAGTHNTTPLIESVP